MTGAALIHLIIGITAGALLGLVYFRLLDRSVAALMAGVPVKHIALLYAVRIGLAVAVFWGLAGLGAVALAAGLAGFLAARLRVTYGGNPAS